MILALIILVAAGFAYYKGWLTFTQTGIMKPLINLTIAGFAVQIKQPDNDGADDTQP